MAAPNSSLDGQVYGPQVAPAVSQPGVIPPPDTVGAAPSETDLAQGHMNHGLSPENAKAIARQQTARHHAKGKR